MSLHIAICAAVLAEVQVPVPPKVPGDQIVSLVFATPPSVSPEPIGAEMPPPPEATASTAAPVAVEPPAAAPIPSPAITPIVRPPLTPKPSLTPKPWTRQAPRLATRETPPQGKPPAVDPPLNQPRSGPTVAAPAIAGEWQGLLAAWLAAHKSYPDEARRMHIEGSIVLRFTADRAGHVRDVVVVRSAGFPILDDAAQSMIRDATLPPFTPGMVQDQITVTIQIRYALAN